MSVLACLFFLFKFSAMAQDENPIIVTADQFDRPYSESTSSIDLITREDIEDSGVYNVLDLLRTRPGLSIPTNGPFGKASSIQIRGTDSRHTLVIIDGVRATDVTSISGGARLEFLGLDQIESIEILRGSQSVLYGSEAIGGVLKITTLKPKEKLSKLKVGYGSYANRIGSASFQDKRSLGGVELSYVLGAGLQRVDGISAFNEKKSINADDDGLNQVQTLAKLSLSKERHSLLLGMQSTDSEYDYDDASADNPTNVGEYEDLQLYGLYNYKRSEFINLNLTFTQKSIERELSGLNSFGAFSFIYEGEFQRIEATNKMKILKDADLIIGVEFEKESVDALDSRLSRQRNRERLAGYFNHYQKVGNILLEGGLRIERFQGFDQKIVYRGSIGYRVGDFTLKSSLSTGFKAPSLYQTFNTFSAPSEISYEQSESKEFGILYITESSLFELTAFEIDFNNFIDFDSPANQYVNRGDFLQRGLELSVQKDLESFELNYSYTFLKSKNLQTGARLVRRPKHKSSASLVYTTDRSIKVGGQLDYVGRRAEINNQELPSYWSLGVNLSKEIKNYQIKISANNLFDRDYEEVLNFPARGRNFLVSLSGEWN
jgi:vitamin B12 transporter